MTDGQSIQSIVTYKSAFDAIMHEITADDGSVMEVWYARELQTVCGYRRWENFVTAVNRAKESCKKQNICVDDHFRDITKTIPMPKGAQKEIEDILLTRYACYLIAQNGDPKKEEIAFAEQSYRTFDARATGNQAGRTACGRGYQKSGTPCGKRGKTIGCITKVAKEEINFANTGNF